MPSEQNPETGSTHLRRMILSQSVAGTAVPMVLFSDDTLAAEDTLAAGGDHQADQPAEVAQAAADLGIDLGGLGLFSLDAYRLQSALGERLAP